VGQVVEFEVHAVTDLLGTLRIAGQDLGELVPGRRTGGLQDHQGMLDCPGTVAESVLERPLDAEPGHGHALPNIASQSIGGTMPSLRASRCRCANVTGSIPMALAIPDRIPAHTSVRIPPRTTSDTTRTMASCSGASDQVEESSK